MIKSIHIVSTVKFYAIGVYNEEFLSELISIGIKIREIQVENNVLYGTAKRKDYKIIARTARKYNTKTKVLERKGIYYKLKKQNIKVGIIYGIALGLVIILIMQNFLWKIQIHNYSGNARSLILEICKDCGIGLGNLSSKADDKKAEILLKKSLSEISWVNVEINGSRADIYIQTSEEINKNEKSLKTPCNIIADKTGIIVETEVYSGTLLYKKGSAVSKGNIIVSGVVNDGANNISLTHANAKIIANFNENVEFRQEYVTNEIINTDQKEIEKELKLFGFVIPLTDRIEDTLNKICAEETNICKIFGIEMPWMIKTNTYTTYKTITVTRTVDDAIKNVEQKLDQYCDSFFSEYVILDINKSYKCDDYEVTLNADIVLQGDISIQQEIYN